MEEEYYQAQVMDNLECIKVVFNFIVLKEINKYNHIIKNG